jgi:hypothetical protein
MQKIGVVSKLAVVRVCAQCGEPASMQCGKCRSVRYCSLTCQRLHWKSAHKTTCASSCAIAESELVPAAALGDLKRVCAALAAGAAANYITIKELAGFPSNPLVRRSRNRGLPVGRGTALGFASICDHVEVVNELLRAGADPDLAQQDSNSAIIQLVKFNALQSAKALLDAGASVDVQSDLGFTALHHAAMHGLRDMAVLLLDAGAKVNALTKDGDSSLFVAARVLSLRLPEGTTVAGYIASARTNPVSADEAEDIGMIQLLMSRGGDCIFGNSEISLRKIEGYGTGGAKLSSTLKRM